MNCLSSNRHLVCCQTSPRLRENRGIDMRIHHTLLAATMLGARRARACRPGRGLPEAPGRLLGGDAQGHSRRSRAGRGQDLRPSSSTSLSLAEMDRQAAEAAAFLKRLEAIPPPRFQPSEQANRRDPQAPAGGCGRGAIATASGSCSIRRSAAITTSWPAWPRTSRSATVPIMTITSPGSTFVPDRMQGLWRDQRQGGARRLSSSRASR